MFREWMPRLALTLGLAACATASGSVRAQSADTFVSRRAFQFPFTPNPGARAVQKYELYVSTDDARNWELHATSTPSQLGFNVNLPRDGRYSFALRAIYTDGTAAPDSRDDLRSERTIVVDTSRPEVFLSARQPHPASGGGTVVGAEWDVRDDNIDASSIQIEGRYVTNNPQEPFKPMRRMGAAAYGEESWTIPAGSRLEIRVTARDRAGNSRSASLILSATGSTIGRPGVSDPNPADPSRGSLQPQQTIVNSKQVRLKFKVGNVGPSKVKAIHLWMCQDREDWKEVPQPTGAIPNDDAEAAVVFDAPKDGLYGLTMIAESGVGNMDPPPKKRDEPQVWVEVDTTPPTGKLQSVESRPGSVTFVWQAADKNLSDQPIVLEYAERPETEKWEVIANVKNGTGRYVWTGPDETKGPFRFHVRMRVIDKAGNQTTDVYAKEIIIDHRRPKVDIITVEPVKQQ